MANTTTATCLPLFPSLEMAWRDVDSSFERFCLTAGIGAVEQMLREDGQQLTGALHSRGRGRVGHRWGTTEGKIGFHGGKVTVCLHRKPSLHSRSTARDRSALQATPAMRFIYRLPTGGKAWASVTGREAGNLSTRGHVRG